MWFNVPKNSLPSHDFAIAGMCSGSGMLETAVAIASERFGFTPACVVHCERDAIAAACLVAFEAAAGNEALVWDDLSTFDGKPWRGTLDCLCAGLPCQPYSSAGKRVGNSDHRSHGEDGTSGPIPHFLRIVAECRPAMVFLENVPAWVMGGYFRAVGDELCRLGYTIEDPVFIAAEDVGAPHERERVFILAHAAHWRERIRQRIGATIGARGKSGIEGFGEAMADSERELDHPAGAGQRAGRRVWMSASNAREGCEELDDASEPTGGLADSIGTGQQGCGVRRVDAREFETAQRIGGKLAGELGNAEHGGARCLPSESGAGRRSAGSDARCGELPLFPPGRGEPENPDHPDWWAWDAIAAVDATLMPRIESELSMVAPGLAFSRADLLRIGGNGVVPLCAATAFVVMLRRMGAVARENADRID